MNDCVVDNVIRSQIVEDYLDFFENKDVESICSLIADDCSLTDWDVGKVTGTPQIVNVFSNIFNSFDKIEVNISHIHEEVAGALICEMVLSLDDEEILVADIFEFDEEDKIKALRAYKG
jgi:ketosteroid isomerase-like protein